MLLPVGTIFTLAYKGDLNFRLLKVTDNTHNTYICDAMDFGPAYPVDKALWTIGLVFPKSYLHDVITDERMLYPEINIPLQLQSEIIEFDL